MTDIYIISGFLGAGKTTLIKTLVRSVFRDRKVVVIENDFGEAGIDAGLLRDYSVSVTSLSAGCICCSLTGDFERAIQSILGDYKPDAIIVEPSGVGKLSDIARICLRQEDQGRLCLKKTITVVDIRSFDKYRMNYGEFFEDQISYADLVLLSHQEEGTDQACQVVEKIRDINPHVRIEADFWDSIPEPVFCQGPRGEHLIRLEMEEAAAMKPVRIKGKSSKQGGALGMIRGHFAREVFSSVTLEWDQPLLEDMLRKKVMDVVEHARGEILRGKGIVTSGSHGLVFHYVPGGLTIEPVPTGGNQVCFIGTGLDQKEIRTLFDEGT